MVLLLAAGGRNHTRMSLCIWQFINVMSAKLLLKASSPPAGCTSKPPILVLLLERIAPPFGFNKRLPDVVTS